MVKTVCITGATGVMGLESLKQILTLGDQVKVQLLVLNDKKNKKIIKKYSNLDNVSIVYGDLRNYEDVLKAVSGSDYVLHIGGMVSPYADDKPQTTHDVNVHGAENVVRAIKEQPNRDDIKVVYIGSVAETGDRNYPIHWGRTGDPIKVSVFDHYGVSKVLAERVFVESGLKKWVVMRQSGILHAGLLEKMEPIMYHVPLNSVLEWCTVEDSGRLMKNFVDFDLPDEFFRNFYNIGSGEFYRLTNFEFENLILHSIGLGDIRGLFKPNWFATRNFHGQYYIDSDRLESYLKFRANIETEEYFEILSSKAKKIFTVPKYIPFKDAMSAVAQPFMKLIGENKDFGTLGWIRTNYTDRLDSHYGGIEEFKKLPSNWGEYAIKHYDTKFNPNKDICMNHGYDENKPFESLTVEDLRHAAEFRGGSLVSDHVDDMCSKVTWKCGHCGREFEASPTLILKGGHWCPHCFIPETSWQYDSIAKTNKFFAQSWNFSYKEVANKTYEFKQCFDRKCYDKDIKKKSKH